MTELHHHNNNKHSTNNTYNNNNSFDWFDRSNTNYSTTTTTEQLPPIQMTSATEQQGLGYSNSSQNSNMMDEDIVTTRKSLSSQHPYNNASSSSSSWMNNNNTQTTTSTGYSPRDSCDLSYDGEDYHHNHGQPTPSPSASTERSRSKKHRTPSTRDIHVEKNTEGKPPYSYATLIKYAIENSLRKKLTLSEIYQWVIDHYPYYGSAGTGWKNSIRHNLSLNKSFVRVPRPINEPGKGSYWQVDYRAAEAELRTKSTMAVRGRANRSGSDPVGNPYRPDSSWASLNNNNNNANPSFGGNSNGGGQRFHRDSRSLSMDSNMNSNKQGGFSTSSSSSSSAAAAAAAAAAGNMNGNYTNGYYGNGYNYNTSSPTTPTRQNNLNNRHSADYSRSSSYIGYDMYANTDGTIPPQHQQQQQQQQQQHYHNHSHHPQQQHHGHQNNNNRISHQQVPNLYDHQHGHNQPPYGQSTASMYPSGYSNYGTANSPTTSTSNTGLIHPSNINEKEEEGGSFSTPQPHYRRVMSTSSPILNSPTQQQQQQQTETKYPTAGKSSPSPPQPSMDSKRGKGLNKPCAVGNNNEYDWIA